MLRTVLALLLLISPVWAQEELLLNYPAPDNWKKEVLEMPPDFAPTLSWKGKECLRFAPGMFKAGATDFFSYTFVLVLKQPVKDLDQDLMVYYQGLSKAVMKDPKLDTSSFDLKRKNKNSYTLHWLEPFTTKKPQDLNLYVEQFDTLGRIWFVCASPKDYQAPIWDELHRYRRVAKAVYEELKR